MNERQEDRQDFYEDNRYGWGGYGHYHYYGAGAIWAGLVIGAAIATLPAYHQVIVVGGTTYYYSSGVYYVSAGSGYTVVEAPPGAAVEELPEETINVNVSTGDTVQYANGAYYDEKPPKEEGAEPSYEVIEPPIGATVPYLTESAVEQEIGGETYYIDGSTVYKPFYSGSEVIYAVTEDPRG